MAVAILLTIYCICVAAASLAGGALHAGGGIGGLVLGRLLDKKGVIALVIAYLLAAPFTLLIGPAGSAHTYLLLIVSFITGFTLFGAQVGLNALSGSSAIRVPIASTPNPNHSQFTRGLMWTSTLAVCSCSSNPGITM